MVSSKKTKLSNVPNIKDINSLLAILKQIGNVCNKSDLQKNSAL